MSDHPVLVPTSEGAVGGVVSEPEGEARAALVLVPSVGRPARSGINSFWARLARELAADGLVVLRYDCSREGETLPIGEGVSGQVPRRDLDRRLLTEVAGWFRRWVGGEKLLLAGACSGAYLAIEMAGAHPDAVAATFLVVPHLRSPVESGAGDDPAPIDPGVLRGFRTMLGRGSIPPWILIGERDFHMEAIPSLLRQLGPTGAELELEVVSGMALHMLDQPQIQAQVRRRLTARIAGTLVALEPART